MSWDIELVSAINGMSLYEWSGCTYNLTPMFREAGCWEALKSADGRFAMEIVGPLVLALETFDSDPGRFRRMNPENGWGDFDGMLPLFRDLVTACHALPYAVVKVRF